MALKLTAKNKTNNLIYDAAKLLYFVAVLGK